MMCVNYLEDRINSKENLFKFKMLSLQVYRKFKPEFYNWVKENVYIAGGSIYSIANNIKLHDIDVYFCAEVKAKELQEMLNYRARSTKFTLSIGIVQFVLSFHGEPCECVSTFDYKHTQYYYSFSSNRVFSVANDFSHLYSNQLSLNSDVFRNPNLEDNVCRYILALKRLEKFQQRNMIATHSTLKDFNELKAQYHDIINSNKDKYQELADYGIFT